MPRTLYSPRLSDDVVRALYREGKRRRLPMTRLADELIMTALAMVMKAADSTTPEETSHFPEVIPIPGKQAA
jgi:hypothetical protein